MAALTDKTASKLLFRRHLAHIASPLHPLLSVATGEAHPAFPSTLLHYYILTEPELDSLAHFYHQRTPTDLSFAYPMPVIGSWSREADVAEKRRRFGRFVGLRGCDSPQFPGEKSAEERAIERWVEHRIRQGISRETELEAWRQKGF